MQKHTTLVVQERDIKASQGPDEDLLHDGAVRPGWGQQQLASDGWHLGLQVSSSPDA